MSVDFEGASPYLRNNSGTFAVGSGFGVSLYPTSTVPNTLIVSAPVLSVVQNLPAGKIKAIIT